jgi:subtilisin family serine protease
VFGLLWRLLATLATFAAAVVAQRALTTGWRAATGHNPPGLPESPQTRLGEAIAYALIAGAVLNVARVIATRQAARYFAARSGGQLPKALRAVR